MKLSPALRQALRRLKLLGPLGRAQTAGKEKAQHSQELRRPLDVLLDTIATIGLSGAFKTANSSGEDDTLEAQLMRRNARLEAAIAELERDGRARRESEKRFRSLVRNTSDIISIFEADGTVTFESPAIERMLGYRPEEQVGTNAFRWVHPDDMERALSIFIEVLDTPGIHSPIELRVPHADGSWR